MGKDGRIGNSSWLPPTACILLVGCLLVAGAQAITGGAGGVSELTAGSDEIVRGTIVDVHCQWTADRSSIVTVVTMQVASVIKGSPTGTCTFTVLGGTMDGVTEWAEDEPAFVQGAEAYVFLRSDPGYGARVLGGSQGVLPLRNGTVMTGSLRKGGEIPVAEYDRYLQGLANGDALPVPRAADPSPRAGAAAPVITGVSPNAGPAGTGATVTITGAGFGTKAARDSNADVAFLHRYASAGVPDPIWASGYPYFGNNPNHIVSWTDTAIVVRIPTGYTEMGVVGSASSGWVSVLTDTNMASIARPFAVTFGYGGALWNVPARFYVNPGTLGPDAVTAITSASETWNAAIPGARFRFAYAGETASTTFGKDNQSLIAFGPASDFASPSAVSQARVWTDSGTGEIIEADIELNSGSSWTTGTAGGSTMSIETVVLHELGHWLQLMDLYGSSPGYPSDVEKVMFGERGDAFGNMNRRALSADDAAGISWIYGGGTPTQTPPPTATPTANETPAGPLMGPVPGGAFPTDTDGDDLYDDVNGNGRADFADIVLFFDQMSWIAASEPVAAFDYNGNGRVDFADVVWLFNRL